ncbi:MAG TPA: ATP-binding SpoIIE family protein phosphatase [Tepidisphaeraceae bacterium]|jgi:anti-sigma regulatory factor (Ser/Thr protein kinase)|nr:ATP-binding SpoIIE family protein phosphatase [Tepidisphaeraceae bacterium]
MEISSHAYCFSVNDPSKVGEVRRAAVSLATTLGFDEQQQGKIAIVVAEAVKNLSTHAKDAECIIQALSIGPSIAIDILALDKGPGMENINQCLRDGYSTAGTAGIGLGAISRLSSAFDIHSAPGMGTVLFSRIWQGSTGKPATPSPWDEGFVRLPMNGEEVCGDDWSSVHLPGRSLIIVADGLGHGPQAAQASSEAVRLFRANANRGPEEIVQILHAGLRATRGAAVAVAELNWSTRQILFAGVGNITAAIISRDAVKSLTSYNGTAGHELRKLQQFTYQWPVGAVLIMSSDGLGTQWRLDRYPGLISKHPGVIAGALYRDFSRRRDDLSVVVVREASEGGGLA